MGSPNVHSSTIQANTSSVPSWCWSFSSQRQMFCHALNALNRASIYTFIPGMDLHFDKGGVPEWLQWDNTINTSHRSFEMISLFSLMTQLYSTSLSTVMFTREKHQEYWDSRRDSEANTTQKAIVHSITQTGIGYYPIGIRRLKLDNHHTWTALFILLCEEFDILCSGFVCVNGQNNQLLLLS